MSFEIGRPDKVFPRICGDQKLRALAAQCKYQHTGCIFERFSLMFLCPLLQQ